MNQTVLCRQPTLLAQKKEKKRKSKQNKINLIELKYTFLTWEAEIAYPIGFSRASSNLRIHE